MASETITHSAIDSESIRAQGIIVNYDYMIISIMLITCHFQTVENLIPSINATGVKYFYHVTMN